MRLKRLTGDLAWHSAARNAEKSCLPKKSLRSLAHRRQRKRPMVPAHASGEQRGPHRTIEQQVAVVAAVCAEARVKIVGDRCAQRTATAGGKIALTPRTQALSSRSATLSK